MLLYVSYGYIYGRLFHTIARQAVAEEEAALEPHGLGFKAGAACSYDSLRRLYWQQRKQQQSTHRNRRLLKPSLSIDFVGLNLDEGFVQ